MSKKIKEPYRCKTCGAIVNPNSSDPAVRNISDADFGCPKCQTPLSSVSSQFLVYIDKENPYDIEVMENNTHANNTSSELNNFYALIEDTNLVIKRMDVDKKLKKVYIKQLLAVARIGLVGKDPNIALAKKALNKLKSRILINEGGKIKNKYFGKLGIASLIIGAIAIGIAIGIYYLTKDTDDGVTYYIHQYFFVFAGSMAGAWVSFGVRKKELKFDELSVMEKDRLNPYIRLLFVGVVSMLFLLFLNSSLITLAIGEVTIDSIMDNIELQILLGAIAGLAGNSLASRLYNIAGDAIKEQEE